MTFKDTPDGQTCYCTHTNNNPSGICDKCLGLALDEPSLGFMILIVMAIFALICVLVGCAIYASTH